MQGQTLKLMKKVLMPQHPDTLGNINNLAWMQSEQGEHEWVEITH